MSLPRLALRDEPAPAPRPGEALVRIEAAGICGSGLHSYLGQDAHRPTGGVIVHVMSTPEREYYQLEQLWSDAALLLRIL